MKVTLYRLKQYVDFNWSPEELAERLAVVRQVLIGAFMLVSISANAADKVTVTINKQTISAYRTVDLEAAKKEAVAAKKPIAWVASSPKLLDGTGTISGNGSKGATLHAFYALRDRCVLVFMDAFEENHKVLQLVDDALHTPDPHYTPPTVVFLDPEAKQVLAKVIYEKDFTKRANDLAKALQEVKGKL
jgi:hypothetical protein